ncbi:hypothetical protein SPRG_07803 [Saprolegnia parasitica CBS 223.65]|uniref:Uncharacterized protein n=1 Tax=Saprolegnia parasitica (strain CBS 223.65) TaxID=695850 RepID=A0A067CJW4_SAPPC|nr:hypothetical protein SPRG_07803 [Saprolegnia parasitica CBS 223.65]KDO27092.1 hypothetical protein SPRG_07803 [Saprolegnia parasitica CBS 223.65]|eukprot:XP_012202186.1 hypothetical protein SPRG_07803 [Saprolegnia parasitica CBS 223.65]
MVTRQEQCRDSQRRYRAKSVAAATALADRVQELTLETLRLEGRHRALASSIHRPLDHFSSLLIAREYFSVARFGLSRNDAVTLDALSRLVHESVVFHGRIGQAAYFDQWRQYAATFEGFDMACDRMECLGVDDGYVVHCVGHVSLRLTRASLTRVFPHTLRNESLVQRLVQRELQVPLVLRLMLNDHDHRIGALDATLGFTAAMVALLQASDVAAAVMAYARLEDSCLLV